MTHTTIHSNEPVDHDNNIHGSQIHAELRVGKEIQLWINGEHYDTYRTEAQAIKEAHEYHAASAEAHDYSHGE